METGEIRLVEAGGEKICVTERLGKFYGFARKCPHAGAPLEFGTLDSRGQIVCPLHGYKFSLESGRESTGEEYCLKTYPMERREDGIYVWIKETGFWGLKR
jgi:nitrite reductase/ring-hydroxylating ferredoxin subunit